MVFSLFESEDEGKRFFFEKKKQKLLSVGA